MNEFAVNPQEEVFKQAERNFAAAREVAFGVLGPYGNEHQTNFNDQASATSAITELFRRGYEYHRLEFQKKVKSLDEDNRNKPKGERIDVLKLEKNYDRYQIAYEFIQGGRVRENSAETTLQVMEEYVGTAKEDALRYYNQSRGQVPRTGFLKIKRERVGENRVRAWHTNALAQIETARMFVYDQVDLVRVRQPNALNEHRVPNQNPPLKIHKFKPQLV